MFAGGGRKGEGFHGGKNEFFAATVKNEYPPTERRKRWINDTTGHRWSVLFPTVVGQLANLWPID